MTSNEIARDNDLLRTTLFKTPRTKVVLTCGVAESEHREDILTAVREFKTFTQDNDPHGEHDFGQVMVAGEKYFWKIDYYDSEWMFGVDPHEEKPHLLLTIMHSSEY